MGQLTSCIAFLLSWPNENLIEKFEILYEVDILIVFIYEKLTSDNITQRLPLRLCKIIKMSNNSVRSIILETL